MKKNFMAIAALLIAAMLLVVSCSQEVAAPKNPELVDASLGLAYGKDVEIKTANNGQNKVITYTYQLTPQWSKLDNGTEIFGNQNETVITEVNESGATVQKKFEVGETVSSVDMGKVTPGLWKVTVNGYTDYDDSTKKALVLQGSNNAYFVKGSTAATVVVSPVNSKGTGKVTITLEMQDLGDDSKNAINCEIYSVTNGSTKEVPLTKSAGTKAGTYLYKAMTDSTEGISVDAGFNTVKFTTPSVAGDGGIFKTFLVIPGNDVTITGSVYPSDFVSGTATIKTVNVSGSLSIAKSIGGATPENKDTNGMYTLNKGTSYTISCSFDSFALGNSLPYGATEEKTEYAWYVDGVIKNGQTGASLAFTEVNEGDHTVTCKVTYSFKQGTSTYTWIGDASLGKIRVVAAPTSSN